MNYFFIVGEKSGDMHAANLVKALLLQDHEVNLQGWGGESMQANGVKILKHYSTYNTMGFIEVLKKLPDMAKLLKEAVGQIMSNDIDAVILVDFSGFNLRLAKRLREAGFAGKLFYYISPKVWVWNAKRVEKVKRYIDAMFCILPFEVDFYTEREYHHAYYIGNPLMDEISSFKPDAFFKENEGLTNKPIVALLPGSRENEILKLLPAMLEMPQRFAAYQFVLAGTEQHKELYHQLDVGAVKTVINNTYNVLNVAHAALVASGTATLETALFNVPQVSGYAGNRLSVAIARKLVKVEFISLPNLILDKEVLKELIQKDWNANTLQNELEGILVGEQRKAMLDNYAVLAEKVGKAGASERASKIMIKLLS